MNYNRMTAAEAARAAEAASLIQNGEIIALSGFTPAGSPKAVTTELAKQAEEKHARGEAFRIGIITGASTGDSCDGVLTRAHAIQFRAPYTTNTDFRKAVNNGEINYTDIHLSQVAQRLRSGFLGHVTTAIVEACELTDDGRIYLTAGVGITPTIARLADRVIILYSGRKVEEGSIETIFAKPLHPYTVGLMKAVPNVDEDDFDIQPIPGTFPNITEDIGGCRFHPRCPYATERCRTEVPAELEIEPGHLVCCHKVEEEHRK